jgi:hypothetical protein
MIGKTVSHYRILGKLGGGSMGLLYKDEDTPLAAAWLSSRQPSSAWERDSSRAYASRPNSGSDVRFAGLGCRGKRR